MTLVSTATRTLHLKLVYDGASASGKTANLQFIQQRAAPGRPEALHGWADQTGRTAFFDYIALPFGMQRGFNTTIHLWATPGAGMYTHTRAALLADADGVVFVIDSRANAQAANQARWQELLATLQQHNRADIPIVLQFNHRDVASALPVETLHAQFGTTYPVVAASAANGHGVLTTLKTISDRVLAAL